MALALDDIKVMNIPPTNVVARLRGRTDAFTAVTFSSDGQLALAGNLDSSWWLWRWREPNNDSRGHAGHVGRVYAVDFSPSGKEFVTAGADGAVQTWQTDTAGLELGTTLERPNLSHALLADYGQTALLAT
jgi:WD40 repeat protein